MKETMGKLDEAGYRLHPKKCEIFKKEAEWMGHQINQDGSRPLQDKLEAITKINIPKNEKKLKSFLGAIQYLSKYIKNLSAQTDILRKLLKNIKRNNFKKLITQLPGLAHYNSNKENILTTDASTEGLGATLWQKQKDENLKPVGFASRFLSDTEKKYAINELELLAVVWGLEHFRLYVYGKPIELLTDYQALESLIERNRSNKTYSARLTRWLDRLAHKCHPALKKMTYTAKPFWWPKLNKDIRTKCNECIPCKMSGKSRKSQIPMAEIIYLPPVEKPNEEIQLDFIGPIRFKHRRFYIISIDRYSRWPAACIFEAPTSKTAKIFLQQYILLNGIPQAIRTDKETTFTGKEFRQMC